MQLNVDTSFWTRYRIDNKNPDLDPSFKFPQADEIHNRTAIPRTDADTEGPASIEPLNIPDHLKAIAFTAGFHFASIEQGGTSLYPSLAQRVTLDKSEGGVKDKNILSVFLAPFLLPERLRTKTLEISR
jgi:hypothetical protein